MNIFFLDKSPMFSAQYQCDKHVVKMILESAQLLSTVQRIYNCHNDMLYKATHINHPCTQWVKSSYSNYVWLLIHFFYLNLEYNYRYNKNHKSFSLFSLLSAIPADLPKTPLQLNLKVTDNDHPDIVQSYRNYYKNKSKTIKMNWTNRKIPWFML